MLEQPPDLSPGQVMSAVRSGWGHDLARGEYLAEGMGAHHWIGYGADDRPLVFVSADRTDAVRSAYRAARELRDAGLAFVLAPAATSAGDDVIAPVGDGWWLSTTPYVAGTSGNGAYADDIKRTEVAVLLGALHRAEPPDPCPRWRPKSALPTLRAALADLRRPWSSGPQAEEARAILTAHETTIRRLITEFEDLAADLLPGDEPWVTTHGEPHTANLRWADDGRLLLIDWDTVAIAPRERDLGDVLARARSAAPQEAYVRGGGSARPPRPEILDLFAREWVLDELEAYGGQLFGPHRGDANDRLAVAELRAYTEAEEAT